MDNGFGLCPNGKFEFSWQVIILVNSHMLTYAEEGLGGGSGPMQTFAYLGGGSVNFMLT